jgi:hypothetical protein
MRHVLDSPAWDPLFERHLLAAVTPKEHVNDGVRRSLQFVSATWPDMPTTEDAPVFVFSTFRSGSTLLQRLINSAPSVGMFGEAFEHMQLLNRMAAQWKGFSQLDALNSRYLPAGYQHMPREAIQQFLTTEFVATLSPGVDQLKRAHYAFFDNLFATAVRAVGKTHWGLKLVRSSATVAVYLRWLYPRAKLIFLCRDPVEAWRSYKALLTGSSAAGWYFCVPDHTIENAYQFGLVYRWIIGGLAEVAPALDALIVRYEDLVRGDSSQAIDGYLGLNLDWTLLQLKRHASMDKQETSDDERKIIERLCGHVVAQLYGS